MTLLDRVRAFALRHRLWTPDTRVLVAVSGGSDSVALTLLLHELAASGALILAGMAHLNHRVRGAESDADAEFCAALATRLGVPLSTGAEDVPARAARTRTSIEVAGREARRAFLSAAAHEQGASVVALAHTRDDQAETLLLRLLRGAGPRGLGGMAPKSADRIRPLLDCSRADLQAHLAGLHQPWREDATNTDVTNVRNRLRHEVIPAFEAHFNPQARAALARSADILRADAALLDLLAAEAAATLITKTEVGVGLSTKGLAALPEALATRVAVLALETADPGRAYEYKDALAVTTGGRSCGSLDLQGVRMERSGDSVVLLKRDEARPTTVAPAAAGDPRTIPLHVPGIAQDHLLRWSIKAEGPFAQSDVGTSSTSCAVVDLSTAELPLSVRHWVAGDRVQPLGSLGRKKLQDLFVDRKVPRDERALVPLVVDASDRIVWVAGHVVAEAFRVTPASGAVVILTLEALVERINEK